MDTVGGKDGLWFWFEGVLTNQINSPISLSFPTGNFRNPFPASVREKTRVLSSWWGRSARGTPVHSTAPRSSPANIMWSQITIMGEYFPPVISSDLCILHKFPGLSAKNSQHFWFLQKVLKTMSVMTKDKDFQEKYSPMITMHLNFHDAAI